MVATGETDNDEGMAEADPEERSRAVVGALLGEVILGTKEMNTKTRTAAYALLIQVRRGRRRGQERAGGHAGWAFKL